MKAPKYIYLTVDAEGKSLDGQFDNSRQSAREFKRFVENNQGGFFKETKFPLKIVRFAVNPTGEVIR